MELGALICTPRSPDCAACPVARHCFARRTNRVEEFPNPKLRANVIERRIIALVVERGGKFLLCQRPGGVVNAHLWEFPTVESANGARGTVAPCLRDDKLLCTVKHSITRYRITTEAWRVSARTLPRRVPGVWRTVGQLRRLAFTSAHRRIASQLEKSRQPN
jgi:A/G-specific adenine glycosylase